MNKAIEWLMDWLAQSDRLTHLKLGTLFLLGTAGVLIIAHNIGNGIAIAVAAIVMGWGIERYQAIRHEGEASKADWAASSAPGVLAGIAYEVLSRL